MLPRQQMYWMQAEIQKFSPITIKCLESLQSLAGNYVCIFVKSVIKTNSMTVTIYYQLFTAPISYLTEYFFRTNLTLND